jgi:PLP dependent protein
MNGDAGTAAEVRTAEIADRLALIRKRITAAVALSGRNDAVTLIAVTKTYPADDVVRLVDLGVLDVGENRDQEAAPKARAVAELLERPAPRWHFVGQLQTNKAKSVIRYADAVHSVDRIELVAALGRAAVATDRTVQCFVQVSLNGDVARGGASGAEVLSVADAIAAAAGLRLVGVMTVAPLDWEPARAFDQVRLVSERLQITHPGATAISAGMSEDFEAAIVAGATHVRLGSAILGRRPALG